MMRRLASWLSEAFPLPTDAALPSNERSSGPLPTNILDHPSQFHGEIEANPMIANTAPARAYVGYWPADLLTDLRDIWLSRARRERIGHAKDDALHMVAVLSEAVGLSRFQEGRAAFDRNTLHMRHAAADHTRREG